VTDESIGDVPDKYVSRLKEIVALTDDFCDAHLNAEYKALCRDLALAVCQEGSPVLRGKAASWASGVAYILGRVNFLGDPGQTPHMTSRDMAKGFGVSLGTMRAKGGIIRNGLGIVPLDPAWCLSSMLEDNPLVWMFEMENGMIIDIRMAPRNVQEQAFREGLIPYIPADHDDAFVPRLATEQEQDMSPGKKPKKKKKKKKKKGNKKAGTAGHASDGKPRCGLCGKTDNLIKTECCGQWICDDSDQYVLFSYARNSCYRNHSRFTLCGYHYNEGHPGHWKDCSQCRKDFESELEMYVYYGTNEYNFEKLEDPPTYEPTLCSGCGKVIVLSEGGYTTNAEGYWCSECKRFEVPGFVSK